MTFSVIIPTVDRIEINRALKTVLNQYILPKEIIIIASSDLSHVEEKYLAHKLIKKVFISSKNPNIKRNFGGLISKGTHLAFLDDDDYWSKEHLKLAMDLHYIEYFDVCCSGFYELKNGKIKPEKKAPEKMLPGMFLLKNPGLRASNLIISKNIFIKIQGFDMNLMSMNDLDVGIKIANSGSYYKQIKTRTVFFDNTDRPRLSNKGKFAKEQGINLFYQKYHSIMSTELKNQFNNRALNFWLVDNIASQKKVHSIRRDKGLNFNNLIELVFESENISFDKLETLNFDANDRNILKLIYLFSNIRSSYVLFSNIIELDFLINSLADLLSILKPLSITKIIFRSKINFENLTYLNLKKREASRINIYTSSELAICPYQKECMDVFIVLK